jgi:hypothetical protein
MKTITDQFEAIVANQDIGKTTWLDRNHGYIQVAFSLVALFAANDLMIAIWRSMTGH